MDRSRVAYRCRSRLVLVAIGLSSAACQTEVPTASRLLRPTYTPYDAAPAISNRAEVLEALEREYPSLLRDTGVGGTALVHFLISETGVLVSALIAETSGHEPLDQAALRVAQAFKFTPARKDDRPVAVWIEAPVIFRPR